MSRRQPAAGAGDAGAAGRGDPGVALSHPAFLTAALVTAACVVITITFHLWDTDFWQHLAVGRAMWKLGRIAHEHLWTWPTYGEPEVLVSWLFRAALWPFWAAGGIWGAFVWRWATTLLAFAVLLAVARRMGARGFTPLLVIAVCALPWAQRTQLRPETLVAPLFAIQLWIHETRRARGRDHTSWLPLVAMLWANIHISYWIGLAVQFVYFLDAWAARGRSSDAPRGASLRLAVIGLASGAASLLNPFGWHALAQPFEYWLTWRHEPIFQTISELAPIDWSANTRNLLGVVLAGWPLLWLARLVRGRRDLAETLLLALFVLLTLSAQRFLGFLALAAVPFAARDLSELCAGFPARSPRVRAGAVAALAIAASLPEWTDPALTRGVGIDRREYPIAAADFMERENVRGRGFNTFHLGGYLLWRFEGQKDRLPFIDIHQSGTPESRRLYALASTRDDAWRELDRRYRFDWVMLHLRHRTDERWVDILDADSAFAMVFADDAAALYVRRQGSMATLASRDAYRWVRFGRESSRLTAEAANDPARRPELETEIARLVRESPFHASGRMFEANLHLLDANAAAAREALLDALRVDPDYPFANERLAQVAIRLGRWDEAERAIRREISIQGPTPELRSLRDRIRTQRSSSASSGK